MVVFGALKLLVLKILSKKNLSGSQIANLIREKIGWQVSCGSLYPLLAELIAKGMIEMKIDRFKKTYTITEKGRNFLKNSEKTKEELLKRVIEGINLLIILEEDKGAEKISKDKHKLIQEIINKLREIK